MFPKGLLKEYSRPLALVLRMLDLLALCSAGRLAYAYKFDEANLPLSYATAIILGALLAAVIFPFFKLYSSQRSRGVLSYVANLLQAFFVLMVLLAGAAFLTKT